MGFICALPALALVDANARVDESSGSIESCSSCRLVGASLDEILRKPRQMDPYGQLSERLDLDKIKKLVCKELVSDSDRERCRNFYFTQQDSVLKWRQAAADAPRGKLTSFHDFVCIRQLKLCCPSDSFGPTCSKCPKCGANEQCAGEGTRQGTGACQCKLGHTGVNCSNCLPGFFLDEKAHRLPEDSSKRLLCKQCHRSCQFCRAPGPKGCEVCQRGFTWQAGYGCMDVDECIQSNSKICGSNTFCVNTEGSHFCYQCDRACDGCHGDGPDMCLRCAKGYKLDASNNCAAIRKTILPPEANYYRYAIYAGLCICTCIILNNNVYLASLVGLGVALYIGASEYVMSSHPGAPNADPEASNKLATKLAGAGISNLAHSGL